MESKFNKGQEVFLIENFKIAKATVDSIVNYNSNPHYTFNDELGIYMINEENIYATAEEAFREIQNQIIWLQEESIISYSEFLNN
jgi:hypothetical protein